MYQSERTTTHTTVELNKRTKAKLNKIRGEQNLKTFNDAVEYLIEQIEKEHSAIVLNS